MWVAPALQKKIAFELASMQRTEQVTVRLPVVGRTQQIKCCRGCYQFHRRSRVARLIGTVRKPRLGFSNRVDIEADGRLGEAESLKFSGKRSGQGGGRDL